MAAKAQNLTIGPVHTHLIHLTGFMLMGFVSVMGANLMETVYIGRVGTLDLAALGFTFPLVMTLQGITMGLSIGASSVVARCIGNDDWPRARKLITHCFVLAAIFILVVIVVTWWSLPAIFELLGANPQIIDLSTGYMRLWLLGLPFFTVAMVGSTMMRAAGDAKTPGYLMTIGSLLQIVLGPLFIFGLFGFPKMGLSGAAVAFIVARFVGLLMYGWAIQRSQLISKDMSGFLTSCKDILHVGTPAIASNLVAPIGMSVITRLLAGHGAVVVAGFSVASRIEAMIMMIIFAISMSVSPFVGQNWGRHAFDRVKLALKLANGFVLVWGVVAYLFLYLTGAFLVSMINDDPSVVEAATWYLLIAPLGMGFMGVMINSTSAFNALGKPMPPLIISILQMIVIGIPMALVGNHLFGYQGIFAGVVVTVTLLGTVSWIWLRSEVARGIAANRKLA
ncbi:MAG: putative MATE family efflux protein [Patiriisocius sp.]|jgi:putative MATE family efflux protein